MYRNVLSAAILLLSACAAGQAPAPQLVPASGQTRFVTLGTQSGPIPYPGREQPANLLYRNSQYILIDVGDGATGQLAKAGVGLGEIDTIFISHLHLDHTGGLFGLIGRRAQAMHRGPVTIYGPVGTRATVMPLLEALEPAFGQLGRPAPVILVEEIGDGATVNLGDITVEAAANSHYANTIKAGSPGAERFVSLSYRFDTPDRSIVFTGDTGPSDKVVALAQGADLLVSEIIDVDGTLDQIRAQRSDVSEAALATVASHFEHEHLVAAEAGRLAREAGAGALVLTHIGGAETPADIARLHAGVAAEYGGPITFANDLDTF